MADTFRLIQQRIERTKEVLEDVDENIRKITGGDFQSWGSADQRRVSIGSGTGSVTRLVSRRGGLVQRGGSSRGQNGPGTGSNSLRLGTFKRLGVPLKRQNTGSAFSRLGSRVQVRDESDEEDEAHIKPTIQSSVVATSPIVRSREDIVKDQKQDKKGQARNKRMFGLLLGTLHKFKQEANETDDKNIRRIEIEQKLNRKVEDEKKAIATEKKELFNERRAKQNEMTRLEELMYLANEQESWNNHTMTLSNFICTKAKPHIFYLPKRHTHETEQRLHKAKADMLNKIKVNKDELNKQLEEVANQKNQRMGRRQSGDGVERKDARRDTREDGRDGRKDEGREQGDQNRKHSHGIHRRRRSSERKGKVDERIISTLDREKRKKNDEDDRDGQKRMRTRSHSGDNQQSDKLKKIDHSRRKSSEPSHEKLDPLMELKENVKEESNADTETGKMGKYEDQVHDRGSKEGSREEGGSRVEGSRVEGSMEEGKREEGSKEEGIKEEGIKEEEGKVVANESVKDESHEGIRVEDSDMMESNWGSPKVDLNSIQLPEGPCIPIQQHQQQDKIQSSIPSLTLLANDFQIVGGVEEQLDYNENMD